MVKLEDTPDSRPGALSGMGVRLPLGALTSRGRSSVGRAPALQADGRRFNSCRLHNPPGIVAFMATRSGSKTGGSAGTNQHGVRGKSQRRVGAGSSRHYVRAASFIEEQRTAGEGALATTFLGASSVYSADDPSSEAVPADSVITEADLVDSRGFTEVTRKYRQFVSAAETLIAESGLEGHCWDDPTDLARDFVLSSKASGAGFTDRYSAYRVDEAALARLGKSLHELAQGHGNSLEHLSFVVETEDGDYLI